MAADDQGLDNSRGIPKVFSGHALAYGHGRNIDDRAGRAAGDELKLENLQEPGIGIAHALIEKAISQSYRGSRLVQPGDGRGPWIPAIEGGLDRPTRGGVLFPNPVGKCKLGLDPVYLTAAIEKAVEAEFFGYKNTNQQILTRQEY